MVSYELIVSQESFIHPYIIGRFYSLISSSNSVKKVANELLELLEGDFANTLRVNLFESQLKLLLVHVLRLAQEWIELFHWDTMILVYVDLPEDLLETLLSQELLLVDGDHHELIKGDKAITWAVCHLNQLIHPLLVEISAEVLSVAIH